MFLTAHDLVRSHHSPQSPDISSHQWLRGLTAPLVIQCRRSDDCSSLIRRRHGDPDTDWRTRYNHHPGRLHGILQHQAAPDRAAPGLDAANVVLRRLHHHSTPYHDHQCPYHQCGRRLLPRHALLPDRFRPRQSRRIPSQIPAMLCR